MNAVFVSTSPRLHLLVSVAVLSVTAGTGALVVEPCQAPAGVDAGDVVVGSLTARRVESQGGMGGWASWEDDRWLVFAEPTCCVVGLHVGGGGGSVSASAAFLASIDQTSPSAEAREALLQWAGRIMADGSDETDFVENDDNHRQWPLPNTLVREKTEQ